MAKEVFRTDQEKERFYQTMLTLRKIRGAAVDSLEDDTSVGSAILEDGLSLATQTGQLIIDRIYSHSNEEQFEQWVHATDKLYNKYRGHPPVKYSSRPINLKHGIAMADLSFLSFFPDASVDNTVFRFNQLYVKDIKDIADSNIVIISPLSTDSVYAAWVQAYVREKYGKTFTLKTAALTRTLQNGVMPDLADCSDVAVRVMYDGIGTGQTNAALCHLLSMKYPNVNILKPKDPSSTKGNTSTDSNLH